MLLDSQCGNVLLFLLALIIFVYVANRKARFVIRITLFYLSIFLNTFLSFAACIPASFFGHACTVVFGSMRMVSKWTGINVETRRYDDVFSKQQSPCVVICNHQSVLDVVVMSHAWPPRGTVMMKRSLAYVPFFNMLAWLCSVIFVDRFSREKSAGAMNSKAVAQCTGVMNEKNLKLWVFPEGTRNRALDGMLQFKKGAFNMAVQAQIPIVPVVASSYKCFYSNPGRYFDSDGEVIVEVMDPIPTTGLSLEDVPALADAVRDNMLVVYDRLTKEVNQKMALKRGEKKHQ